MAEKCVCVCGELTSIKCFLSIYIYFHLSPHEISIVIIQMSPNMQWFVLLHTTHLFRGLSYIFFLLFLTPKTLNLIFSYTLDISGVCILTFHHILSKVQPWRGNDVTVSRREIAPSARVANRIIRRCHHRGRFPLIVLTPCTIDTATVLQWIRAHLVHLGHVLRAMDHRSVSMRLMVLGIRSHQMSMVIISSGIWGEFTR